MNFVSVLAPYVRPIFLGRIFLMSRCYAYIRVSTLKQAEKGVSLQEQRAAIMRHAATQGIDVVEWFEECITAAKQGRPLFTRMLKQLRAGDVDGVIMHKIDRSARNLRDWSEIGELVDAGVMVHFANESMDLKSRGGRLAADIQAVVAADYIRNLREEILKGIRGRLNEGLTPFAAPLGYKNNGKGKAKSIDPMVGPLVRQAFELYAAGGYGLHELLAEMTRRGLRNRRGKPISLSGLSEILNNPFYMGFIRIKSSGKTYPGKHPALVPAALFKAVRVRLSRRVPVRVRTHDFMFRGLFRCTACNRSLIGERQKGHVYYRCHGKGCASRTFREELLEGALLAAWPPIAKDGDEKMRLLQCIEHALTEESDFEVSRVAVLNEQLAQIKGRHSRLVDALLDGTLDKASFEERKQRLLVEQAEIQQSLSSDTPQAAEIQSFLSETLELASTAQQSYFAATPELRRELVLALSSNRTVSGKDVSIEPYFPSSLLANFKGFQSGAPGSCRSRTLQKIVRELISWAREELGKHPRKHNLKTAA